MRDGAVHIELISVSGLTCCDLKAAGQQFMTDHCNHKAVRTLPALWVSSHWQNGEEFSTISDRSVQKDQSWLHDQRQ